MKKDNKNLKLYNEPASSLKNKTGNWGNFRPVVDKSKCIACGKCQEFCPEPCIFAKKAKEVANKKVIYYQADYDYCKGCGICAEVCPVKCIKMVRKK